MKDMMEYNGYVAKIEYDDHDDSFYGIVSNIADTIHFEGRSVRELKKAFKESMEEYIKFCEEQGRQPDKPFSGKFLLRIPPDLHRETALAAKNAGKSLNVFVTECLDKVLHF